MRTAERITQILGRTDELRLSIGVQLELVQRLRDELEAASALLIEQQRAVARCQRELETASADFAKGVWHEYD